MLHQLYQVSVYNIHQCCDRGRFVYLPLLACCVCLYVVFIYSTKRTNNWQVLAAQACVQQYLERIKKRAINGFDTLSRQVLVAQDSVWFETVEGLANALPFFCKRLWPQFICQKLNGAALCHGSPVYFVWFFRFLPSLILAIKLTECGVYLFRNHCSWCPECPQNCIAELPCLIVFFGDMPQTQPLLLSQLPL